MSTMVRCFRRRRCRAVPCLFAPLLLILLLSIYHRPINAKGFFNKKADKDEPSDSDEAVSASAENDVVDVEPAKAEPIRAVPAENTSEPTSPPPPPTTTTNSPPSAILEAQARTARELSQTVGKLKKDLTTCNFRVDAIEEGFQNLYAAHLGNIDGLRKCKEGVLTADELEKLDSNLDRVNPALVEQAAKKEEIKQRYERTEELSRKHRELIYALEDQVEQLVRREKSWERTISELVARRDLLEKREGAWERTIGDLMGEIEIRNKREGWWEEMKVEMEGRIGALSQVAVLERFGPGPHYVSMTVILDEGNGASQRQIIFQLAPHEIMPHSIHLFLSQIAEGYWSRGTPAIAINADHVLQACPHPCLESADLGGNVGGYPYNEMKEAGLDVVSFQEYSPKYPHEKYTIGFAGQPHSGPEFYINLMDNTLDHGTIQERKMKMNPNIYKAWAEEAFGSVEDVDEKSIEPYPCFGKVIEGFDVVDKIAMGMTRASLERDEDESGDNEADEDEDMMTELDKNILLAPIKIASMTILEDYRPDECAGDKGSSTAASDEL